MKRCWEKDPKLRPGFSELVKYVGNELEGMSEYMYVSTFTPEEAITHPDLESVADQ